MKLLFLTDNFPPEVNAPATRTYEHCREWVKEGIDVTVITCAPNFPFGKTYDGYKNKLYQTEEIDGIKVIRVWSFMAPNKGFILRIVDFISFSITSFMVGLFQKTDIIIATSPQFFTAMSGRALSFFKRKKFVLEIRDLWPEQILASTNLKRNAFIKYLEWEELKCYKRANLIVTVTNSYVNTIVNRGIGKSKFEIIKNGVDKNKFKPLKKDKELLKKYNLHDKFVIGYIGTHGLSQNLSFIIDGIFEFNKTTPKTKQDTCFLFVGEGAEKEKIRKKTEDLNIQNVIFVDQIKKEEMPKYLSLLDISLVPLKKAELYFSVIPSKIFELSAMNIPILLGVDGEARKLIEKYNCGLFYEPDSTESFLKQLNVLISNKNDIISKYKQGCEMLSLDYDRKRLALKLLNRIEKLR